MIRVNLKVKFPEVIDNRVFPNIEYVDKIYDAICLDDKGMIYIIDAYGEIRPFPMHYVRVVTEEIKLASKSDSELLDVVIPDLYEKNKTLETAIEELQERINKLKLEPVKGKK